MKRLLLLLISITVFQFSFAQWSTNSTNVYYNGGHVGIGTSTPSSPWSKVLQVYDANNAALSIKTPVRDWQLVTAADGGFCVYDVTGGGCRLYISSSGDVGIGTTSPRKKFETVGVGMFSSSPSGSGLILDGSRLATTNTWSSVQLTAGDVGGGEAYLKTSLYNWGGYFSWTRGSSSGDVEVMRINASNGNVGIGTSNPQARFHVVGGQIIETSGGGSNARTFTLLNAGTSQINFGYYAGQWRSSIQIQNNNATKALFFAPAETDYNYGIVRSVNGGIKLDVGGSYSDFGTNALTIESNGNIGINTAPFSQYKLAVNGDAIFTKVKVKTYATWPDYVFHSNYNIPSLKDLEKYIKQNNHLPDVPSASEIEKNGLDLGDNQAVLLKKIEELTLYIIEQDKKIESQNKQLESQQKQIKELLDFKKEIEIIKSKLAE